MDEQPGNLFEFQNGVRFDYQDDGFYCFNINDEPSGNIMIVLLF